jgi:hypothetical protein
MIKVAGDPYGQAPVFTGFVALPSEKNREKW